VPGGAERIPCPQARRPRLRHGQRPDHAHRHRPRAVAASRGPLGLSGRRGALMDQIYASESPLQVLLITGLIGGGAAWLAGRAIAHTWRPFWHVIGYMALLGCAVRFVHFALFEADLVAPLSYAADTAFLLCVGCLAWRVTRTTQMV